MGTLYKLQCDVIPDRFQLVPFEKKSLGISSENAQLSHHTNSSLVENHAVETVFTHTNVGLYDDTFL